MKILGCIGLISLSTMLVSCGGGNTQSSTEANASISGKAIDGYLKDARVCLDINRNLKCESTEFVTKTDALGNYKILAPQRLINIFPILVEAIPGQTVDLDNPNVFVDLPYTLVSPAGLNNVTPFSTIIFSLMQKNPNLTLLDATKIIESQFKVDDSTLDYIEFENTTKINIAGNIVDFLKNNFDAIKKQSQTNQNLVQSNFTEIYSALMDEATRSHGSLNYTDYYPESALLNENLNDIIQLQRNELATIKVDTALVLSQNLYQFEFINSVDIQPKRSKYSSNLTFTRNQPELNSKGIWTSTESTTSNSVVLSENGWKLVKSNNDCKNVPFQRSGLDVLITCDQSTERMSVAEIPLAGVKIKTILKHTALKRSYFKGGDNLNSILDSINVNFSPLAKAYRVTTETTKPTIYINCGGNTLNDPRSTWVCFTTGFRDEQNHVLTSYDQLFNGRVIDFSQTNEVTLSGSINDESGNLISIKTGTAIGTWKKVTDRGENYILFESNFNTIISIATVVNNTLVDSNIIVYPSIDNRYEYHFNEAAMRDIDNAIGNQFPIPNIY